MVSYKKLVNIAGWTTFAIAMVVYFYSVERTGSLWDVGEFVLGAYKLQVVHPPGAALFLLIGRLFTWVAELFSNDPSSIAFSVNLMSGICSAFAATFICWCTIILGKLCFVGRDETPDRATALAITGGGLIAGLATAFCSSVWFSAVEGEVYAMSTFFTTLTLWAMMKWYALPDKPENDKWIVFAVYIAALSTGVHLLSILTFPALALFYYFKKYKEHTFKGMAIAAGAGVAVIVGLQSLIITGIPKLWTVFELMMVNGLGMGFHTGLIPLTLLIVAILVLGLRYAHKKKNSLLQKIFVTTSLVVIGFSTVGVIVIRANANTPVNMNAPSDAMRLLPYLNREQYGERQLLKGPHFDAQPVNTKTSDRYGMVGDKYEIVDYRMAYEYDSKDEIFLPRIGHSEMGRPRIHRLWMNDETSKTPTQADNFNFLIKYQIGWMYWRYFAWNFIGRQNGDQGYYPWLVKDGHWLSGIPFIDSGRLYNQSELPNHIKNDKARNTYFFLPFIFGLIGMFFHYKERRSDFLGLLALFVITGIGIIIYSNQPPNEPRERDYVLVGSFFTYCIWIGMGSMALFKAMSRKIQPQTSSIIAVAVVLTAPFLMASQNFDDHSRRHSTGARDYAANFLNTCEENAIIFTYGDNDTYPLWYAQEVEGIRRDVRVVNLSLIQVDWYINQLRRKVNDSPAIRMSIPREAYRGFKRNQVPIYSPQNGNNYQEMNLASAIKFVGEDHPLQTSQGRKLDSYLPTNKFYIPVNKQKAIATGTVAPNDTNVVDRITFSVDKNYVLKGDLAMMDIIASNEWDRPIYYAVTVRPESFIGLQDYTELQGLGLKFVPVKTPQDRSYGIIGNGRINADRSYENIMTKFAWGNFDKKEMYIDKSYGPSVQSQRILMMRTANQLVAEGKLAKGVDICKKYFEAFPHFNFPYDSQTIPFLSTMVRAGAIEQAKPHIEILAEELLDRLIFFNSLKPEKLQAGFSQEYGTINRSKDDLIRIVSATDEKELADRLTKMFAQFTLDPVLN